MGSSMSWSFAAFAATVVCGTLFLDFSQRRPPPVPADADKGASPLPRMDGRSVRDFLPRGSEVLFDKPNARGWKQTGRMPLDMEYAISEVDGFLKGCGYSRVHDVGSVGAGHLLTEWKRADGHRVMWAVWPEGRNRTGFSWGEVQ